LEAETAQAAAKIQAAQRGKQARQEVPEEEPMKLGDPYDNMIPSAGDADAVHTRGYELGGGDSWGAWDASFNVVRHDSMGAVNAALNSGAAPATYMSSPRMTMNAPSGPNPTKSWVKLSKLRKSSTATNS